MLNSPHTPNSSAFPPSASGQNSARTPEEHFAAVLDLVLSSAHLRVHERDVDDSIVGLVLAEDVRAQIPLPPFSNSAMDGFLICTSSLDSGPGPWTLSVVGDVPAGGSTLKPSPGQAVRIMTGGPVPEEHSALCVVPVELTTTPPGPQPLPQQVTITEHPHRHHIRSRGEHIAQGQLIANAGELVDAGTLAALLSAGVSRVSVYMRPRVGLISTGAELSKSAHEDFNATPEFGTRIPDSNGPMLSALARRAGAEVIPALHSSDSPTEFAAALDSLAENCDLIVTTGGVSAGAFDVVHETLGQNQSAWFGHVTHKPGAPQGHATWKNTPVICLPGNPVAAFLSFHLYVSRALAALAGHPRPTSPWQRPYLNAAVNATAFPTAAPAKTTLIPVHLDFRKDIPVATPFSPGRVGSHLVASLSGTQGFAAINAGGEIPDTLRIYLF